MLTMNDFLLLIIGALLGLLAINTYVLYKTLQSRIKEVREIPRIPREGLSAMLTNMVQMGMKVVHMQETATGIWSIWVQKG